MSIWNVSEEFDRLKYNDIVIGVEEKELIKLLKCIHNDLMLETNIAIEDDIWYVAIPYDRPGKMPDEIYEEIKEALSGIEIKVALLRVGQRYLLIKEGL